MITLESLTKKITERISDYIEFDVNEIFEQGDFITIYGGAVRDSIANLDIHDVDILCMPDSAYKLRQYIENEQGYELLDLYDQDSLNMYKEITAISEPWTLMNKNKKIIQIIRPRHYKSISNEHDYESSYSRLIKNVDISACGVFIELKDKIMLKESCKNAILHCLSKTFEINKWASLYNSDRTTFRKYKLENRGWVSLSSYIDTKNFLLTNRSLKLNNLEFHPEYNYKIWTEDEYKHNASAYEHINL
jgi:hypothetical protein